MFLDLYTLKKLPYKSAASRNSYLYNNKLSFILKKKPLSIRKKSNYAGSLLRNC